MFKLPNIPNLTFVENKPLSSDLKPHVLPLFVQGLPKWNEKMQIWKENEMRQERSNLHLHLKLWWPRQNQQKVWENTSKHFKPANSVCYLAGNIILFAGSTVVNRCAVLEMLEEFVRTLHWLPSGFSNILFDVSNVHSRHHSSLVNKSWIYHEPVQEIPLNWPHICSHRAIHLFA